MPTMSGQTFDPTRAPHQTTYVGQHDDPTYLLHKPKDPEEIQLRFRSYQPYTKALKSFQLPTSKDQGDDMAWVVDETEPIINAAQELNSPDFATAYPIDHNPTWDLKRDLRSDMNTLDQRTQDSISVLMQQRLLQNEINSIGDSSGPR